MSATGLGNIETIKGIKESTRAFNPSKFIGCSTQPDIDRNNDGNRPQPRQKQVFLYDETKPLIVFDTYGRQNDH